VKSASPSFLNDVMPLFTRFGCNQGACHGKNAGQNGFRLSLRGYAPELDHQWLTREFAGRRVSTTAPEDSLLLRKPAGLAAHEGGKLFGVESRAYRVLLDWVRSGAPGPLKSDPAVVKLEATPAQRTFKLGETQQLAVQAHYSDGTTRDVTWLSKFDSNDAGLAEVDADGVIAVRRNGETSVRISFQGQVAVVIVTAPFDAPVDPARLAVRNDFIDDHVFNKLAALHIEPSDLCDDATFLRRAFLDAIGTLPTPDEVRAFLTDRDPTKRAKLIDALLERPEFVDYWALQLGDLFQNRRERDHDVRGTKGVRSFHIWLLQQVARNRPWDELARDVLTATGPTSDKPAVGYFVVTVGENSEAAKSEVASSVAQAFLGTRIGCARCHNHPLEKYTQDDYFHFAAYFARVHLQRKDPKQGPTTLMVGGTDGKPTKTPIGLTQPRTGLFMAPQPLDRTPTTVAPDEDPRVKLVAWMTDPKNEYFAGAMVNRVWRHYLGVGLVEPVDDLRNSNPPSNPELWAALKKEFVGHKFDLKHLMRVILNSRTYQLSSATRPGNVTDTRFCSHYRARRLPAEVLLDALCQTTGIPDEFTGYPVGTRAIQVPDTSNKHYFLTLFGKSDRVTACACERSGEVTLPQLMHLENGDSVVRKISSMEGRLLRLLKDPKYNDDALITELFLVTLSRPPSPEVLASVRQKAAAAKDRHEFYRDLFWALLNATEFSFNH
jgi:hypothetical protein